MTLPTVLGLPVVRSGDIFRLNKIVRPEKRSEYANRPQPLQALKQHHRKWMERILIRDLSASQYTVLSAIVSRTFGWQKIVETIPLSVFARGMRDRADTSKLQVDEHGLPYFAGTGLSVGTIRTALDELAAGSLIERYAVLGEGRETHAYMPVPFWVFSNAISKEYGLDDTPECFHVGLTGEQTAFEYNFLARWLGSESASGRGGEAANEEEEVEELD